MSITRSSRVISDIQIRRLAEKRAFLFGLFGIKFLPGSGDGMEKQMSRIAFVEESPAEEFHIAKLTCGKFVGDNGSLGIGDGRTQLARDVDINAVHLLVFLLWIDRLG